MDAPPQLNPCNLFAVTLVIYLPVELQVRFLGRDEMYANGRTISRAPCSHSVFR